MEPSWLLEVDDRFTVNKVAALDQAICKEDPEAEQVALTLAMGTNMDRIRAPVAVYIPKFLTPALLTGTCSLHVACKIIWDRAKNCASRGCVRPSGPGYGSSCLHTM